jgi:hypothetical protein
MVLTETLIVFVNSTIDFLPKLVASLILLAIGWLVGGVIGRVIKEILTRFKVDHYLAKGKKLVIKLSDILPLIFRWTVYLMFIQAAVQTLGITTLVVALDSILTFIPGLVKAIIVVLAGYALAEYVRRQVEASMITYSDIVAKILFFLILYIAIAMALPLVGIDPTLVNNILLIIIGSFGLGIAIAIGLGLKDTIATMAKKRFK